MSTLLTIEPADPKMVQSLAGKKDVALGETIELPGGAKLKNISAGALGFDWMIVAKFIVLSMNAVACGLVANYLYDKLRGHKVNLKVGDKYVTIDRREIEAALRASLEPGQGQQNEKTSTAKTKDGGEDQEEEFADGTEKRENDQALDEEQRSSET